MAFLPHDMVMLLTPIMRTLALAILIGMEGMSSEEIRASSWWLLCLGK